MRLAWECFPVARRHGKNDRPEFAAMGRTLEIFEKFMLRRNFRVIVDNKIEPLIKCSSDFAMLLQSLFTLSFKLKWQLL